MTVSTPQTTFSFRPATLSDVPILLPLIRSAYRGELSRQGWTTEADLVADQRIDERGLSAKINEPEGAVLIVNDNTIHPSSDEKPTAPLACCEIVRSKQNPDVAYFGLFAVSPERQAGGVGRKVLGYAEEFARREWGVTRMEMCVLWMRGELIAWYKRRGYKKTGERREFPYAEMVGGGALRDDLWFEVLEKEL
ncbi:acetyltransferase [Colletotrichum godetiae]|uniref:Acetyltransferase n=1 Tax=Colletotrichum godetiae TaxID=1209918 RepID=A0AAJ0AFP8_9PEZI|nr:acetyltransferase [Colletotrichum godetiae]KAK1660070.1 acetyltransferase [Colletotrichum godetiae]